MDPLPAWMSPMSYNDGPASPDLNAVSRVDDDPIDYSRGPHDSALGVDDDDERDETAGEALDS